MQRAARLDPLRSLRDQFLLRGREIFLRLDNGVARTKSIDAQFDARLATLSTLRNWRTVQTLLGAP